MLGCTVIMNDGNFLFARSERGGDTKVWTNSHFTGVFYCMATMGSSRDHQTDRKTSTGSF